MVDYPKLPYFESGTDSGDNSTSRQEGKLLEVKSKRSYESDKQSSEESDEDVSELSGLIARLERLKESSHKSSEGESSKQSDKDSRKEKDSKHERSKKGTSYKESEQQESSTEKKKATQYTKEQREEVTRIRRCSKKDYYAILDLKENCSQSDIKRAYRKLSMLTHPDKNKYKDAPKAFKLISKAYQVLGNSTERTSYNRDRKSYKLRGELDPINLWGEEFADNASGTDSESESDSDDSEEEEEIKLDDFRLGIYQTATPWVRKLLANPHDSVSKSEIESLNKQIKKQNKEDGLEKGEFLISTNVLRAIGIEAEFAAKALEKDPDDKRAKKRQGDLEKQLKKTILTNSYPQQWLDFLPWRQKNKCKGRAEPTSSDETEKKKKKKGASSEQDNKDSDTEMSDVATRRRKWKPGQETRKGERILGWRPFYKTDRKPDTKTDKKKDSKKDTQFFNGCQFVIEKKGQPNPIALVSGEEVGRRVVDAYRSLPEEEQNDIRYSEKRYTYEDANRFDTLLGFACKPFNNKTKGSGAYYPDGYALYSFTDGSQDLVSRSALREVFGKTDADNEIAEFYEDIGEIPPWLVKPKKLLIGGNEVKRQRKSRRRADSDDQSDSDSDSDSDSSSIFVSAKKKGRRHARDAKSSDNDNSSSDDSGNERKGSRIHREKGNLKKAKTVAPKDQSDAFMGILQKFVKHMAEENRRQAEDMSKKFEEVLSRIPAPQPRPKS